MKRTLSIAVTTLAMLALFVGCANKPVESPAPGASAEEAAATTTPKEDMTQPTETPKPAEPKADGAAAPAQGDPKPIGDAAGGNDAAPATYGHPGVLDPAQATETAPASFKVKFVTTAGDFVIEATRDWAPNGVDRLYNLVKIGYYENVAFFRVIGGFMAQFGIHGDPRVNKVWRDAKIADDPIKQSNKPGFVTFAMAGPNTRTTQLFINFVDNNSLDGMGFPPIGKVVEGMDVANKIYSGYGEGAPRGRGPSQGLVQMQGNSYLKESFPQLDYIKKTELLP